MNILSKYVLSDIDNQCKCLNYQQVYLRDLKLKEKVDLLLEDFESSLGAGSFELPPFSGVELLDGCGVVSECDEWATSFLAGGEDSCDEADPVVQPAWFSKEWQ